MSQPIDPPPASTRSELRHLREHSQATVAELQAFLREMKGRSPQEMLGMVTGNPLVRALGQATLLTALLLAACTLVPYLTRKDADPPASRPATTAEAPEIPAAPAAPTPEAEPTKTPPDGALETLGIGEEKSAPADSNPLDADPGGFLDELE